MHSGWSRNEPGQVWNQGLKSTWKVLLRPNDDLRMNVECMPFEFLGAPEQRLEILVNNNPIKTLAIKPGQITIPSYCRASC